MNFGAVAGHRYGRATPSLRDAQPQRAIPSTGRGSTYRSRNGVSTKPATSLRVHLSLRLKADVLYHGKDRRGWWTT
jgi:hypothetical protein